MSIDIKRNKMSNGGKILLISYQYAFHTMKNKFSQFTPVE